MSNIVLGRKLKIARLPVYFVRTMVRILTYPLNYAPESTLKDAVRRIVLRFQNSLPLELAASKHQTAIQIGTPRPRTVQRLINAVGEGGKVIVLEAEPTNYRRLSQHFGSTPGLILVNAAAWSSTKTGKLQVSSISGDHKIDIHDIDVDNDFRQENERYEEIDCEFVKIDDVLEEHSIDEIHYLSVTVNGAELEVLKGAQEYLSASENIRVYAKGHSLKSDGTPINVEIKQYLNELGFTTMLTKGEPSSTTNKDWLWRAGDVYAWKRKSK